MSETAETLRLDKWLFFARFFKSRGVAAERIERGGIRLNGQPCRKPGRAIRPGDLIVISAFGHLRCIRVTALPDRRGPASEAREAYEILDDGAAQKSG
ncbi:RNA-binding S4 domain-containing protein [Paracoccus seriniphilus]|uniref:RNA-binding S4 domain-containing protein n=1 Tax=Paracoccus seriniphilus TaxID=184748 RepID=UPI0035667C09